jgi:proteasome lid subunit RPN8/RPN11
MTESGTDGAANLWSVPQCPFPIETSPRVLDDIRLAVVDAFFSLPRGGAEIGGVLLGSYKSGKLAITGYAALDCEHAYGPSFTLSPPDEARLKALLAAHSGVEASARPVGWYHSHTRSEIFLSDADLQLHQRYFPEAWQVALVIKPHTFQPARVGFFFREADGSMRTQDSYREITLEALPLRQVPNGKPSFAPADQPPLRRWRPEPEPEPADRGRVITPAPATAAFATNTAAAAPQPAPDPNPEPDPEPPAEPAIAFPVPQFLPPASAPSHRWIWVLAIGIGLGVGAAGFQTRQAWLPKMVAAVNPAPPPPLPPPTLGLNATDHEGQLQINWDRNSRALLEARDAVLEITEGEATQAIQLDSAHLRAGSFTYARQAEKVDVKLIVNQPNAPDVREVTSFLGKLPDPKPSVEDPEVQKQRDELARQAAKLKLDLNWQALKTKKLEKDLQSMREEMRQQQLKRLTNQLPDK